LIHNSHVYTGMVDFGYSTDLLKSIISKRESTDQVEMDSLVSSDRAPRNSYVRFGRTPSESLHHVEDPLVASAAKRSKNYVRFGRDGRHYVRFGRSWIVDPDRSQVETETRPGEETRVKRSFPDESDVLFGRDGEVPEASLARVRRSSRSDRLSDHSTIQRLIRNALQPANKHYVRFGRSRFGDHSTDAIFGDNAADFDDNFEIPSTRPSHVGNDKRSGAGKTYVRFGRRSPSGPLVIDGGYYEELGDVEDGEPTSVGKRSKNYVRFGRSGSDNDDDDEEETVEEVAKRADYIRFG